MFALKAEDTYSTQGSLPCPRQGPESNVLSALLIVGIVKKARGDRCPALPQVKL